MIGSKALRALDRNALDLPVAAIAALAVAFLAYAMPSDLLADLVARTGLPSVLPAAEPPLGAKARFGFGAAAAGAAFLLVLALLRLIDRAVGPARGDEAEEEAATPPRLRRRDFHPDAPPPRPIVAARDLGEPAPPVDPPTAEMPIWLSGIDPNEAASAAEPNPAPAEEAPPEAPNSACASVAEDRPQAETVEAPNARGPIGSSIPELMARLERGLAERRTRIQPPGQGAAAKPAAEPDPQVFPETDDRLRSAIDSLQRLAARQH